MNKIKITMVSGKEFLITESKKNAAELATELFENGYKVFNMAGKGVIMIHNIETMEDIKQ